MRLKSLWSGFISKTPKYTGVKGTLFTWIKKLESYSQPPKGIIALNFGLFESDKGFMIYLTGSKVYDPTNGDWATEINYEPISLYKYLLLPSDDIIGLKWGEVLELICLTLKDFVEEHKDYRLFKNRIVTAGFDDGDLVIIKS